jgi:2-keto-4-pentenoate hydratase/2-oxohepta-3-ene-1,7-dioic acid hydratase in catechol pathway
LKIICIGRNYAEHAKELKHELPKVPVFFLKPETALVRSNRPFFLPDFSNELHYELELVLKICKVGKYISEKFAHTYWDEIGLGIDFTARDLQRSQSEKGLPWEIAKAFDNSAPISKFFPKSRFDLSQGVHFHLLQNGKKVQEGNSLNMVFSPEKIIEYVSQFFTLKHGDLIFTGTPAGVGPVSIGDILEAYLEEEKVLWCRIK